MSYDPMNDWEFRRELAGRRKEDENATPGEWQYDSMGRKFRKVGHTIEYAPTIQTSHGTVYMDELADHNKRMKEQSAKRIKELQEQQAAEPSKDCPFKKAKNGIHTLCDRDCVFFEDTTCILASVGRPPTTDTKGSYCPIARMCNENCALYQNGCTLTCILKGILPGKE